ADAHRPLARLTGDRHEAAHALGDLVDAGPVAVWPVLSEAADAAVHDARIDRADVVPGNAQPLLDGRPHVFDDHVGGFDQPHEGRVTLRRLQVQTNRALVAVQILKVEAVTHAH